MDALRAISEKLDVEHVLTHYGFDKVRNDGVFLRACCKIHDGSNASGFVISSETGLWYCHTGGCGGGDIYTLVEKLRGVPFTQAVRIVAELHGIDVNTLEITPRKADWMQSVHKFMKVMRDRKKVTKHEPHTIPTVRKKVTKFRGFLPSTLEHFKLSYVEQVELIKNDGETYRLRERLLCPIESDGIEIGFSLRRTRSDQVPKWSHQPNSLKTGELLYNIGGYAGSGAIVVTEGIFDVWAFHEIGAFAVCTYGAHLSDEQYRQLIRSGADIVLAYDGDEAGLAARDKAIGMLRNKCNLSYIVWESGEQDPESVPREKLKELYLRRKRI